MRTLPISPPVFPWQRKELEIPSGNAQRVITSVAAGAARHELLEILEERYGRRSTIITSQIPVDKWHELIGDPTYADAILDRIVHNAHRINLTGHSLRRSRATKPSKD